ncbi:MAG: 2-isopropylmalate synthase [Pseudomonadota bacterium]
MTQADTLTIFDTTLRDGEQAPGCSMTLQEKLRMGRALADLGVDVIEAGFPASSPGDFESVQTLAREIEGPTICGLARCNPGDIDRTAEAIADAKARRIHVFIATSPIHLEHKLNMTKSEVLAEAIKGVEQARGLCDDVEFSAEDALRTEPEYLAEVFEAAIAAGATTVNVPDTVGYTMPGEMRKLVAYLVDNVKGIGDVTISTHCHDDLGLAVANSLSAVSAGARQVECTINGIGERAGNCSLEEVVMAIRTRPDLYPVTTNIDTTRLYPTSRLLTTVTGMQVARNKAIVGANAFAHEAGIHQHGMLKHSETYEIMRPQDVGIVGTNLVLGKHSGRHALRDRAAELGYELDDAELARAFKRFKALADKKKEVFDSDIEALVLRANVGTLGPWSIEALHTTSASDAKSSAQVRLSHTNGDVAEGSARGNGPVEAAFCAIEEAVDLKPRLEAFDVHSVSVGEDAQGEVSVTLEYDGKTFRGQGVRTDIIEAGARAFLQAINRIESHRERSRSDRASRTQGAA